MGWSGPKSENSPEVNRGAPVIRDYDRKVYKKCIKCRQWLPRHDIIDEVTGEVLERHAFGKHPDNHDGLQVQCLSCKGEQDTKRRNQNVATRLRHHIATRCVTQLGKDNVPPNFVRDMEDYLGYRIQALVRHLRQKLQDTEGPDRKLRDALDEGYHVDHRRPLSLYEVVTENGVDWDEFQKCWAIDNLVAIPAAVNLAKGARYNDEAEG